MPTTTKKTAQLGSKQQVMIQVNPNAKQIDFNSNEIKKELDKLKVENKLILEAAMVDTQKLSIHFTV